MSTKRADDMATIEAALSRGLQVTDLSSGEAVTGLGGMTPAPEPAPEKTEAQTKEDAEKQQKAKQELELKRQSQIKRQVQETAKATARALDSTKNGLSDLRIPGGLTFPLLTLLVLFMLLVRVNGNSRLGWLWQVVAGNAALVPQNTGGGSTVEGANGSQEGVASGSGGGPPPRTYLHMYEPLELDEYASWQ